jgi:hypothetical protein
MACYLIRLPRASLERKVAEEVWTGKPIEEASLKKRVFVGYSRGVKGFKL